MWWTEFVFVHAEPEQVAAIERFTEVAQVDALTAHARRDPSAVSAWGMPFLTASGEPAVFLFGGADGKPDPCELRVTPPAQRDGAIVLDYSWQSLDGIPQRWHAEIALGELAVHALSDESLVVAVSRLVDDGDALWALRNAAAERADRALRGLSRRERAAALARLVPPAE
jgi:hypothetical protein